MSSHSPPVGTLPTRRLREGGEGGAANKFKEERPRLLGGAASQDPTRSKESKQQRKGKKEKETKKFKKEAA